MLLVSSQLDTGGHQAGTLCMTGAARTMGRMTKAGDNRYLAPSEVPHLLNVSMSSVYRACEEGTVPHVQLRPNGALRIPASALRRTNTEGAERR